MNSKVREGEKAPDFSLQSQDGRTVSLHDFLGKKNVVVYFYPKDFTIGCTAEAKKFSENYDELLGLKAEVVGISSDSEESHGSFASYCEVKFPLLSDRGGKVREMYGVRASLGLVPGRVTFVIDKEGVVRKVFSSQINATKHVAEAIDALKTMPA